VGTCAIVALIALYIAWRFDGSRFGFAARAVRDDPDAAASMGISVRRIRIITFALGGMLVGLGGAVQAQYVLIVSPSELGFFSSINYIIYLLFGGLYTLWGPVLGASILTIAPEALRFAAAYRLVAYGVIIIAIVLWRPDGLLRRVPTAPCGAGRRHILPGRRRPLPSST
jgi:branched-chain amino acid transport system permease protein